MDAFIKSALTVAAVTVAMLAAIACGEPKASAESGATITTTAHGLASCDTRREQGSCVDYTSSTGSFGVERSLCRSAHGDFRTNANCPVVGQVGSCVVADGEVKRYYAAFGHGFTAESAKADCEESGLS